MPVYLVQHARPSADDSDSEDVKVIGIYSSEKVALAAVERARTRSGFDRFPDAFHIGCFDLDDDYWCEGFISIDPDTETSWQLIRRRLVAEGWVLRSDDSLMSPHAGIVISAMTLLAENRERLMRSVNQRIETMREHRRTGQWYEGSDDVLADFELTKQVLTEADG